MAGAEVRACPHDTEADLDFGQLTGPDGVFRLTGVPPDTAVTVAVGKPGFGPVTISSPPGSSRTEVIITLGRGATVFGVVRDSAGKPVPGVTLRVLPRGDSVRSRLQWSPDGRARGELLTPQGTSDASGNYRISGIEVPFAAVIRACADDGRLATSEMLTVRDPNSESEVDLTLTKSAGVCVRILLEDGSVCTDARLEIRDLAGVWRFLDLDGGSYRVGDLAPGEYRLSVMAPGYLSKEHSLELVPSEECIVELRLLRGRTLTGRVMDTEGAPLQGVTVWFRGGGETCASDTNVDGAFLLGGLDESPGTLFVAQGAWLAQRQENIVPGRDLGEIVLERGSRLRIRVKKQLSDGTIQASLRHADGACSLTTWSFAPKDDCAEFFLTIAPNSPAELELSRENGPPFVRAVRPLRPGELRDLGLVEFPDGRVIRGVVLDSSGAPLHYARVAASGSAATTGTDGKFVLEQAPSATFELRVEATGFPSTPFRVPAEATDPLSLVITPGGTLRLVVIGHDGEPLAGACVSIARTEPERPRWSELLYTDSFGAAELRIPPGRHRLDLFKQTARAIRGPEFRITDGEARTVEFVVDE